MTGPSATQNTGSVRPAKSFKITATCLHDLTFSSNQASRVFGSDHDCPFGLPLYKPRAASSATVRGLLRHLHRLREREARIDRLRASLALECMPMTNAMLHFHV